MMYRNRIKRLSMIVIMVMFINGCFCNAVFASNAAVDVEPNEVGEGNPVIIPVEQPMETDMLPVDSEDESVVVETTPEPVEDEVNSDEPDLAETLDKDENPESTNTAEKKDSSKGHCGIDAYWELNSNGMLTIGGDGPMYDYRTAPAPWSDETMRDGIVQIMILDGVSGIGANAFADLCNVTAVVIPESVEIIGEEAFRACSGLKKIDIPEGVKAIKNGAFARCENLEQIRFPHSLTNIGANAFKACEKLKTINYSGTEHEWALLAVEGNNSSIERAELHCLPEQTSDGIEASEEAPVHIENVDSAVDTSLNDKGGIVGFIEGGEEASATNDDQDAYHIEAPKNLIVSINDAKSARLSWDAVEGATSYRVYRSAEGSEYTLVKSVTDTVTITYNLNSEVEYRFKIAAVCTANGQVIIGDFSEEVSFRIELAAAPQDLRVEQLSGNGVKLSWSEVQNCEKYRIYRSTNHDAYVLVKTVSGTGTATYGLDLEKNVYTFKVAAVDEKDGLMISGEFSEEIEVGKLLETPQNLRAIRASDSQAQIVWDAVEEATAYRLYRSTDGGSFNLVKTVTGTSTNNYSLDFANHSYSYQVCAIQEESSLVRRSKMSIAAEVVYRLEAPENVRARKAFASTAFVSWDAVDNATGYRIYRSSDGIAYSLVKTVVGTSTYNYGLNEEAVYQYKVAAICVGETLTLKGDESEPAILYLSLGMPEDVSVEYVSSSAVKLQWEAVEGATAYRIYRTNGTSTVLIKTVENTETITYGIQEGECYSFEVKAIRQTDGYTLNGEISEKNQYFHQCAPEISVEQEIVNEAIISCEAIQGADTYRIYNMTDDGALNLLIEKNEPIERIHVTAQNGWMIYSEVEKDGYTSALSDGIVLDIICESSLAFDSAVAIDAASISLTWLPQDFADYYEIERESEGNEPEIMTTTNTNWYDNGLQANTEYKYRYRTVYLREGNTVLGNWSESASVKTLGSSKYRAVLIGEENYESGILEGPINDINAMKKVLNAMPSMEWDVCAQADAEKNEIIALIDLCFDGATEDDVSLFYYSGHGVMNSGEYYSGALVTYNYEYIPLSELAEMLSSVPGKVIVILDSCGSGAAIASENADNSMRMVGTEAFNEAVISAFSAYNKTLVSRIGEFRTSKFYVLTASAYEQESKSLIINGIGGGALTRGIVGSAGFDFNSGTSSGIMHGDTDGNGEVSLKECYAYCVSYVQDLQDVQIYPDEAEIILFRQ